MSAENISSFRSKKNCLLVFRNKKINNFEGAEKLISEFSDIGYYFDKIAYIAYDRAEEIVNALRDGKTNYQNVFIYCPNSMDDTMKAFLQALYRSKFDEKGILTAEGDNVFIIYSDTSNVLKFSEIKSVLDNKYGIRYEKACVKIFGVSPSHLNSVIYQAKTKCPEIDFSISESYGDYRLEITYSNSLSKEVFDSVMRTIVSGLNENIYAMDNVSLAERLFQLLKLRRMKIGVAESFTGGGIAKKLVEIAGISEVYYEGLNTYSDKSKAERLGINEFTLNRYGAVSEQTAYAMAEGLLNGGNCNVCIATTGIAGPTSDSTSKPVGLIYIAVAVNENISVFEYNLKGNRETITNTAINLALFHTFKLLK